MQYSYPTYTTETQTHRFAANRVYCTLRPRLRYVHQRCMPAAAQLPGSLRDLTLDAFPGFVPMPLRLGLGALTRLTRLTLLGHSDHLCSPAWHTCAGLRLGLG